MVKTQAYNLDDREFKSNHPGAIIIHEDRADDVLGTMDETVRAIEAQAHPG